jgi:hypothetical protein
MQKFVEMRNVMTLADELKQLYQQMSRCSRVPESAVSSIYLYTQVVAHLIQ